MPFRPKRFGQQEQKARRQQSDRQRGSAAERGYGARWDRNSSWYRKQPECILCACGCKRLAEVVDHIIAVSGPDDELFWKLTNWQPLAKVCHREKTNRFDGGFGRKPDTSPAGKAALADMLARAAERAAAIEARMISKF